ncbi:MAG: RNA polymerase sigma factor [Vicinamibacteria bacterium]|nr:RNA polymerase sigma factor [Vicinamibacteria bacterium]
MGKEEVINAVAGLETREIIEQAALTALDQGRREEALDVLMRSYGQSLYRYCRQMLRDAALAEDVLQITFLEAFRDFTRFEHRSSIRSWLFGIAAHRCLDALKKRKRWAARFAPLDAVVEKPHDDMSAEDDAVAAQINRRLANCVQRLDPQVRTAVLLRYIEGFSYPEMATVCGHRPATLQARVARALPVLRRCLEEGGVRP